MYLDSCSGGQFLERMRLYMPPKHRAFIEAVAHGPSIRHFGEFATNCNYMVKSSRA